MTKYLIALLLTGCILAQTPPPPQGQQNQVPIRPIGGTLLVHENLPPYLAGNVNNHIVFSGYGESVYYSTQTGTAFSVLAEYEERCDSTKSNPHSRGYQTKGNDFYYYCLQEHMIYVVKAKNPSDRSADIKLASDMTFTRSKYIFNDEFILLLGIIHHEDTSKAPESHLIFISESTEQIVKMTKIQSADGDPIVDLVVINPHKIVAVSAKRTSSGLIINNFYLGSFEDTTFSNLLGVTTSKSDFVGRYGVSPDKRYFIHTGVSEDNQGLAAMIDLEGGAHLKVEDVRLIKNKFITRGGDIHYYTEVFFISSSRANRVVFFAQGNKFDCYHFDNETGVALNESKPIIFPTAEPEIFRGYLQTRKNNDEIWLQYDNLMFSFQLIPHFVFENVSPTMGTLLGLHTFYGQLMVVSTQGIFVSNVTHTTFSYFFDISAYFKDEKDEACYHIIHRNGTIFNVNLTKSEMLDSQIVLPDITSKRWYGVGELENGKLNFGALNLETFSLRLYCGHEMIFDQDAREIEDLKMTLEQGGQYLFFPNCKSELPTLTIASTICNSTEYSCSYVFKIDVTQENVTMDQYNKVASKITRLSREAFMINHYDFFLGDIMIPFHGYARSPAALFSDPNIWGFFKSGLGFHMQKDGRYKVYVYQNHENHIFACVITKRGVFEHGLSKQVSKIGKTKLMIGSYRENTFLVTQETEYSIAVFNYVVFPLQNIEQ